VMSEVLGCFFNPTGGRTALGFKFGNAVGMRLLGWRRESWATFPAYLVSRKRRHLIDVQDVFGGSRIGNDSERRPSLKDLFSRYNPQV
jgi:hypothetical protein